VEYEFKPSFDRRFRKLGTNRQQKAYEALDALMSYFDGETSLSKGLGLKNWQGDYWEIRTTLRDRIIFKFTDHVIFLFIGSHDEIRAFMRGNL
jgi:mRNA-degrading endonuclease YafQ of YafQ-DinJ toxin-antitoxin module